MSNIEETRRGDDWKLWKSGWRYKTDAPQNRQWKSGWKYKTDAPQNREWNKDRTKLFKKNGNGWWLLPNKRCEKKE